MAPDSLIAGRRRVLIADASALAVLGVVYFWTALARYEWPGAYMDSINPDYLVARTVGEIDNVPSWVLPGNLLLDRFPVLGPIYHGALTFYTNLPIYLIAGTGIGGIRLANAFMGFLVLASLYAFLRHFGAQIILTTLVCLALALSPAFSFSFRTQFGVTLVPMALLLWSTVLITQPRSMRPLRILVSGFLVGLAVYGYFIYLFLAMPVAVLAIATLSKQPSPTRSRLLWVGGVVIGASGYLIGLLLGVNGAGGLSELRAQLSGTVTRLDPARSDLGLLDRLALFGHLARIAVEPTANQLMMLGKPTELAAPWLRFAVPLAALLVVAITAARHRAAKEASAAATATALVVGILVAYAVLVMTFGDRLWAHHLSGLSVLLFALVGAGSGSAPRALGTPGRGGVPDRPAPADQRGRPRGDTGTTGGDGRCGAELGRHHPVRREHRIRSGRGDHVHPGLGRDDAVRHDHPWRGPNPDRFHSSSGAQGAVRRSRRGRGDARHGRRLASGAMDAGPGVG